MNAEVEAYARLFMPTAMERQATVLRDGIRFAYYTTAATALDILRNQEIWMRSLMVMNDFSEVEHAQRCLLDALDAESGARFKRALDMAIPGLSAKVLQKFFAWCPGLRPATFVTCLSEHTGADDAHGRLSMWRAYGGAAGVALVVKPDFLNLETGALGAFTSPVGYLDEAGVNRELAQVAENLEGGTDLVRKYGEPTALQVAFEMLRFAAVSIKHPAFLEEREWRIVACPVLHGGDVLEQDFATIGGIPQPILKLPLRNAPDLGLTGLDPNSLIDRVLIGPCEHSGVIRQALAHALTSAGVENAASKIIDTGIPLRPNQR